MKLLTKYNRINLLASVAIFLLASIAFYFLLRYVLISQVDEDLEIEQHEIMLYAAKYNKLPEAMPVKDQLITFDQAAKEERKKISTVALQERHKRHRENFRQLVFFLPVNEQWYKVTVSKSLEGTEDITRSIIIISLSTILVMLASGTVINRVVLSKLWQPFYKSLEAVNRFKLGKTEKPLFSKTDIDEFNVLNSTLEQSIQSAESEYSRLKEFTENASHELQTPLAVIRSKMDVLIQDEHLTQQQSQLVQSAYAAIEKLSRLNQSLLLLSKIENNQFSETTEFNLATLVEEKLNAFKEIWQQKNFSFSHTLQDAVVNMNPALAEVLLNNLFSNATRHTLANGKVIVKLTEQEFFISNSAVAGALDTTKLFQRFYKGGQSSDHYGLGLSIVQQICAASGLQVYYNYANSEHQFYIRLKAVE